jgi:hypothetical protein
MNMLMWYKIVDVIYFVLILESEDRKRPLEEDSDDEGKIVGKRRKVFDNNTTEKIRRRNLRQYYSKSK